MEELNYTLKAAIGLKLVLGSPNNLKPIPEVHKSAKWGRVGHPKGHPLVLL